MATLSDKLLVVPTLSLALGSTVLAALTGPFRGKDEAPTYGEHVLNTLLRSLLTNLTIEQTQWLIPSFVDAYKSWCTKHSLKPDIVDIPNTEPTAHGFWLGNKSTAKYTLIYYHGGGFIAPGTDRHLDMLLNFIKWSNNNIAIFCVEYTLSPGGVYPTALAQSVEGLRYIMGTGRSPDTILLGGDSAGGNLVLAVLSHISAHPHPQNNIVKPLEVSGSLRGAVVIAPWTSSDSKKYPSMDRFAGRDIVNKQCANYWIEAYKGRGKNIPDDEYVCAALAPSEWWKGVKCDHMLCVAGQQEGLIDAITDWEKKYEQGAGADKIKFVIGEREIHDAPLNPRGEAKLEETGEQYQEGAIRMWIKKNFA